MPVSFDAQQKGEVFDALTSIKIVRTRRERPSRELALFFNEFFSTKNEILPRNKVPHLQIIRMQGINANSAARDLRD